MTKAFEEMLQSGIIDPVRVTRSAVQNAASIPAIILTTEVLSADIPGPTPTSVDMGGMI